MVGFSSRPRIKVPFTASEMKEVFNMVRKKPVRPPVQASVVKPEPSAEKAVAVQVEAKPAPVVGDGGGQPVAFVKAAETPAI